MKYKKLIARLEGHTAGVLGLSLSKNEKQLATCSID